MVEVQEWSISRRFRGSIFVEGRAEATTTAREWRRRDTIWIDGSRQDSRKGGAACAWQSPRGRAGSSFLLGTNNAAFDTEVFAIYQAL